MHNHPDELDEILEELRKSENAQMILSFKMIFYIFSVYIIEILTLGFVSVEKQTEFTRDHVNTYFFKCIHSIHTIGSERVHRVLFRLKIRYWFIKHRIKTSTQDFFKSLFFGA